MSEESFLAGFKFHSLVDEVTEDWRSRNIYPLYPERKYLSSSLKSLEDEILYDRLGDWKEIVAFFDKIPAAETKFGIEKDQLKK